MLLGDVVSSGARKYGARAAYRFDDTTRSFDELLVRTRRLANVMLGVAAPGDRVAILSQNTPQFVEAYFGVPTAGMALTFLNYRLAPRELARIMNDAEATVVLVEDAYLAMIAGLRSELLTVRTVVGFGDRDVAGANDADLWLDDALATASDRPPDVDVDEDDLAWVIYTSGTTGMPKGAMLSHRNLMTGITSWMVHSATRPGRDVQLLTFPLCHVAGIGVISGVLLGTTLVIRRAFEPEDAMVSIDRFGVTGTSMAPTMLNMFLSHPRIDDYDLSSLRTISYGGSSMTADTLRRAMTRFPDADFVQGFGMTELAGNVLYLDAESHREALERPALLTAAGQSMALSELRLVDDDMHDVPVGEIGEIVVRGDQVMLGYWQRPDANEEAFAGGWFHTGDLGRAMADGYVAIVDRKKDMIVTGGENVYSREVEEVIQDLSAVFEVAVIGVPDPHWGENVVAVVVPRAGAALSEGEVVDACRRSLAGYKKPKRVVFVDELPRNASGKILKRELRDQLVT
ncbi:MAG: long-chain-fatty-acid--CoA ligase [Ilumatobacteraceae bacterium]